MTKSTDYFSDDALREDLKGKTVRGGVYTGGAQAVQTVIQLAAVPMLSRLLTPGDFGLVAMVTVVTGFANMFVDAGLSMATVQRSRITHEQVSNLFWVATGLGLLIALIVALLSPVIAWFYGEPRLMPITLALTASLVMAGLTIQPQALMRRGMRFRAIAVIQVLSVIVGQVVAISWAWYFRSYWAIVLMPIVTASARAVGTWSVCGWRPGMPQRGTNVWPMIGFGSYLMGMSSVNYIARNIDYILIGWYWGPTLLGFYERAYKLLMFPLQQLNGPMATVAVPALSRLVNEPHRYRSFWRKGCSLSAVIQIPMVLIAALTSREFIRVFLGPAWDGCVPVFQALIPAMLLSFTAPATSWAFTSWGRPDKQLVLALVNSTIIVIGFGISLPYGVIAMAWTFSCIQILIRPFSIAYCFAGTPLRWLDFWLAVRLPVWCAIGSIPMYFAVLMMISLGEHVFVRLVVKATIFVVLYCCMMIVTAEGRAFLSDARTMLGSFTGKPRDASPSMFNN